MIKSMEIIKEQLLKLSIPIFKKKEKHKNNNDLVFFYKNVYLDYLILYIILYLKYEIMKI